MFGFCPVRKDSCNTECMWYYEASDSCAVNTIAESLDTLAVNDTIRVQADGYDSVEEEDDESLEDKLRRIGENLKQFSDAIRMAFGEDDRSE